MMGEEVDDGATEGGCGQGRGRRCCGRALVPVDVGAGGRCCERAMTRAAEGVGGRLGGGGWPVEREATGREAGRTSGAG